MKERHHSDLILAIVSLLLGSFFISCGYLPPSDMGGIIIGWVFGSITVFIGLSSLIVWITGNNLHAVLYGGPNSRRY